MQGLSDKWYEFILVYIGQYGKRKHVSQGKDHLYKNRSVLSCFRQTGIKGPVFIDTKQGALYAVDSWRNLCKNFNPPDQTDIEPSLFPIQDSHYNYGAISLAVALPGLARRHGRKPGQKSPAVQQSPFTEK